MAPVPDWLCCRAECLTVLREPFLCKCSRACPKYRSAKWGWEVCQVATCNYHPNYDFYLRKFCFKLMFPSSAAKYLGAQINPGFSLHLSAKAASAPSGKGWKKDSGLQTTPAKGDADNSNQKPHWEPSPDSQKPRASLPLKFQQKIAPSLLSLSIPWEILE